MCVCKCLLDDVSVGVCCCRVCVCVCGVLIRRVGFLFCSQWPRSRGRSMMSATASDVRISRADHDRILQHTLQICENQLQADFHKEFTNNRKQRQQ